MLIWKQKLFGVTFYVYLSRTRKLKTSWAFLKLTNWKPVVERGESLAQTRPPGQAVNTGWKKFTSASRLPRRFPWEHSLAVFHPFRGNSAGAQTCFLFSFFLYFFLSFRFYAGAANRKCILWCALPFAGDLGGILSCLPVWMWLRTRVTSLLAAAVTVGLKENWEAAWHGVAYAPFEVCSLSFSISLSLSRMLEWWWCCVLCAKSCWQIFPPWIIHTLVFHLNCNLCAKIKGGLRKVAKPVGKRNTLQPAQISFFFFKPVWLEKQFL